MRKLHQQMEIKGRKFWMIPIPQEYKKWLEKNDLELVDVDVAYSFDVKAPLIVTPKSPNYTGDLAKFPEVAEKLGI